MRNEAPSVRFSAPPASCPAAFLPGSGVSCPAADLRKSSSSQSLMLMRAALSSPSGMASPALKAFLANSYALTPSTLLALNRGATCICSPMKALSASSTDSFSMWEQGKRASMPFSRSKEGVVAPKLTPATYSLSCFWSSSARLVAGPMHTSSTPVARGSRVPACPTFSFFFPKCLIAAYLILRITSAEVQR